jgi:apolipoprotein N-acyltransferase
MNISIVLNIFFALVSGIFTRLAFPEFNFYLLSWLTLTPFIWAVVRDDSYKRNLLYATLFGLSYFGLLFSWCPVFYDYAEKPLINLAWAGYAISQTFFILLVVLIFKFFQKNLQLKNRFIENIVLILNFSFLWILFDWLRSLWIFGNTVGGLCYSQYLFLPFIQLARYIGPYGLTFILVFFNSALAVLLFDKFDRQNKTSTRSWTVLWIVLLLIFGFWLKDSDLFRHEKTADLGGMVQKKNELTELINYQGNCRPNTLRLAIFQPAIPQKDKLNYENYTQLKKDYLEQVRQVYQFRQPDLIILPETIVPEFLLNDKMFMFDLSDALESPIIFGTPRWKDKSKDLDYYNSAVMLDRRGELLGYHDKRYLVPFGEYIPFRKYLAFLFKGTGFLETEYAPGTTVQPMGDFGTAICFESTLPYQLRQQTRHGARALLTITNDAWFKDSFVLEIHLSYTVLRAVENGRYFVQAANSGISAVVDNHGKILKKLEIDKTAWLEQEIKLINKVTPYTMFGEIMIYLALIYLVFIVYRTLIRL